MLRASAGGPGRAATSVPTWELMAQFGDPLRDAAAGRGATGWRRLFLTPRRWILLERGRRARVGPRAGQRRSFLLEQAGY